MQIKSIVAGAAIALAAATSSASAADQFTTLDGIAVAPMNAGEMAAVVGADLNLLVNGVLVTILGTDQPSAGLTRAGIASGGVVEVSGGGQGCPPNCGL